MTPESQTFPAHDFAPGATVGRFRLLALAGAGGMGKVWKAEDPALGRTVALKFLPVAQADSPVARRRFLREARAAGRLSHPSIAQVFDAGEANGRLFIAIEWVEGKTIADLVARGPLGIPDSIRIARDTALALAHAHGRAVLHRDVSARNIMVARDGRVMLLDFGLAYPEGASRITSTGTTPGTIPYMAPEVVMGRRATLRSDLYSLGAVLYEMLTGCPPFRGERVQAVLYAVVHQNFRPAGELRAGVPPTVERILNRALARRPGARFASADAMARALTLAAAPRYLAVQPFQYVSMNAAADAHREMFAAGVSESVAAQLARHSGIVVAASVPSGPETPRDGRALARACGADLLLHGTLQHVGERIRISYSLLDELEGVQIAGDVLDGSPSEIFQLQDLLVRRIAQALVPGGPPVPAASLPAGPAAVAAHEHYLQALGYLHRHDNEAHVDAAIRLLEELRSGERASALVEAALGRAYVLKYQATHDREWERKAVEACQRALRLDAKSAEVYLTLGEAQRISGRLGEAARSFRRALRLRAEYPEAATGLARVLEAQGRLRQAEEIYRRAIILRPGFWESYHRLGALCFNRGRYRDSIGFWNKVVELTPDNARAHYNLGGAYFRLEEFGRAIEAFDRAIAIRPEASAYSNLGTVHYFLGHAAEAATMFEKAVALRPNLPRLWGNLGDAYRWLPGRADHAAAAYDRAIALIRGELELNPRDAESVGWLAEWLARRGHLKGAVPMVRRALRLAPRDVNGMARAVNVFHLAGDRSSALRWLGSALKSGYGRAEFERDPDLAPLRESAGYQRLSKIGGETAIRGSGPRRRRSRASSSTTTRRRRRAPR